jgi:hypothetical protein
MLANGGWDLTLILLTWTIWRAPTDAGKWRMGFNSAFKGLICVERLKPTKIGVSLPLHYVLRIYISANFTDILTEIIKLK